MLPPTRFAARDDGNISATRGFAQELAERRGIHDAGARLNHFFCERLEVSPFLLDRDHGGSCDGFASSHEDLVRNNAAKRAAHQKSAFDLGEEAVRAEWHTEIQGGRGRDRHTAARLFLRATVHGLRFACAADRPPRFA